MSNSRNSNSNVLAGVLKAIIIGILRVATLAIAFALKFFAIVLDRLSTVLQKWAGYGTSH